MAIYTEVGGDRVLDVRRLNADNVTWDKVKYVAGLYTNPNTSNDEWYAAHDNLIRAEDTEALLSEPVGCMAMGASGVLYVSQGNEFVRILEDSTLNSLADEFGNSFVEGTILKIQEMNDKIYVLIYETDGTFRLEKRFIEDGYFETLVIAYADTTGTSIKDFSVDESNNIYISLHNNDSTPSFIKILANGSFDTAFNSSSYVSGLTNRIMGPIQLYGTNSLGVAEYTTGYSGVIHRMNADGSSAYSEAQAGVITKMIPLDDSGGIYIVGGTSETTIRAFVTGYFPSYTVIDSSMAPDYAAELQAVAKLSDGSLIVSGLNNGIDKIISPGVIDTTFKTNVGTSFDAISPSFGNTTNCTSIIVDAHDKIIVAGSFTSVNGITRNFIAKLNSDGTF